MKDAERKGVIIGACICSNAPSVSHLLFADDSLLLVQANRENAKHLQSILQLYESVSDQTINKEKLAVLFSRNTRSRDRRDVKDSLQIVKEAMNDRYLGLPVNVGNDRAKTFAYLKDRIWQRI